MSIFDKLKNLTTGNVDIMTRVAGLFPPLEADSVRNRTNLIQKGKENGSANLPGPEAQTQDSVELDIKSSCEELRDRYKRDYDAEIAGYRDRIANYSNVQDVQAIHTEFDSKLDDIKSEYVKDTNSLFMEAQQLKQQGNNIRSFRKENNLEHRLPDYPKDRLKSWMIISVLALAELALNFFLLRESGEVIDVAVQSLLYGLINVILPFALFANIIRYINHVNPIYRNFSYLFIIFYILYTLFINLLIAHYRGISIEIQLEIEQAVNQGEFDQNLFNRYLEKATLAFAEFQNSWFGLKDVWSWFMFLGGCGLSLGAIREGYISDDKYPGYSKAHKNYESDFADFIEETENTIDTVTKKRNEAIDELRGMITNLENNYTRIPSVIQSAKALKERCEMSLDSIDTNYNMLLKEYRTENSKNRSQPEPKFFDEIFSITKPDLKDLEVQEIKDPSEAIKELQSCSDRVNSLFQEKLEELQTTKDLLGKSPFEVTTS